MAPAHKEQWGGEVHPYMDNSNKLLVDAINKKISTSIKQDLVWVGKERAAKASRWWLGQVLNKKEIVK